MTRLALFLCTFLYCTVAFGQGHRIYGEVVGDMNTPLTGAQVDLLQENTHERRTSVTDIQGRFAIDNVPKGRYLLRINSLGYTTYLASINLSDDLYVGRINLADTTFQMAEVKVSGSVIPLHQSNDTTTYNAKAYKTFADADAFYLLSKMPGFKMLDDKVVVDGDSVSKLLLNGEVLFNNDIILGLKTIPASGIESVQTYNDKSEKEQLTGFKDDKTTKVIDLKTKEGFKLPTGKAYAGAGDKGAYAAGTDLTKIESGEQISINASSNNVNYRPLALPDPEQRNAPAGINRKTDANFNFTKALSKKITSGLSYSYYENNRAEDRLKHIQFLGNDDSRDQYREETSLDDRSRSHRAMANISYQINARTTLRIRSDFDYRIGNRVYNSNITSDSFNNSNTRTGFDRSPNISNGLTFTHGFQKKGRTIDIKLGQGLRSYANDDIQTGNTYSLRNVAINQRLLKETKSGGSYATITFTEPINKWNLLELSCSGSMGNGDLQQEVFNFSATDQAYTIRNNSLSNTLKSKETQQNGSIKNKYQRGKVTASAGLGLQTVQLGGVQSLPISFEVDRKFSYLLPEANVQYQFTNTRSAKISYNTSVLPFRVTSLAAVVDNTDPVQYKSGNPSLKPEYNHYWRASYQSANNERGTRVNYSLSGMYKQHRQTEQLFTPKSDTAIFGTAIAKGTVVVVPINLGAYKYISGRVSYSTPLNIIKCNLKTEGDLFFSSGLFMNNTEPGTSNAKGGGVTLELSSNISEQIDFSVNSNTTVRSTNYSIGHLGKDQFFQQVGGLFVRYSFLKHMYISTQASFLYYQSAAQDVYNRMNLVDVSTGCKVLKNKGDIKIVAHDIFNQNKKVEHNNMASYVEDIRTIGIQRYFMLIFTCYF